MRITPPLTPGSATPPATARRAFGIASLDAALGGGLASGRIHEVYAAEPEDAASAAGFAMGLMVHMTGPDRPVVWLREPRAVRAGGVLQAQGWDELGGGPGRALAGMMDNATALLRAAVDALRCAALGGVIMESWGPMRELDLTASRRLALAAERSGVPLVLLRTEAQAVPSAAQTRWQVAAAPSSPLPGNAPGLPAFDVTLLRQRSGPCGMGWRLEWDRDRCLFREAPLPGAVVPLSANRPAANSGSGRRRPDRRAA